MEAEEIDVFRCQIAKQRRNVLSIEAELLRASSHPHARAPDHPAPDRAGVGVRQTKVGDRYVLEAMKAGGYSLGGEQSGHVIMSEHATTGDGILTALHVLERMATTGRSLEDLAGVMTRLPQVLVNVPDVDKARADDDPVLAAAVAEAEADLGDDGRVLLRPSGTEPLVRVMVEATSLERAEEIAESLAGVVRSQLAL